MIQISGVDHWVHYEVRSEKWRDSLHSFLSHDHLRCNDNYGDDSGDDVEHIPAARVSTESNLFDPLQARKSRFLFLPEATSMVEHGDKSDGDESRNGQVILCTFFVWKL